MSLTSEQKKDLKKIGSQLRELERMAQENSIDLDVFMTEYGEDGVNLYSTEKISQRSNAGKRKKIFEKQDDQKKVSANKH